MFDSPGIPKGLAEMPPGLQLAGFLASIDRESLSGHDRVLLMRARSRQLAYDQAEFQADIFSVSEVIDELWGESDDPETRFDVTVSEVSTALHWTRRGAESQVVLALQLAADYPQVLQALREGSVDLARARVICDQTSHLEPELRSRVADQALESASSLTTGQLRARLARLAISVDPDIAEKRYEEGLSARRITCEANPDGTANLYGLQLPAAETQAAMRRINRIARSLKHADEVRSIDQLRADVFLDLLSGGSHRGHQDRGVVDLKVDLTTLAGLDDNPGQIPGWGPVIADVARQIAAEQVDAEWRITITDPDGAPVAVTTTRRRPTAAQRRQVEARNPTCVFPGCRFPSIQCDIDHTHPWADTHRTCTSDLEPLCRHHHVGKHQRGWKLKRIQPATYQWTSPLGHTYTVGPDPP